MTYCGQRVYTILGATPISPAYTDFLSMDTTNNRIIVTTDLESHVGTYDVTIRAELRDFAVGYVETTFKVYIKMCKIQAFAWKNVLP